MHKRSHKQSVIYTIGHSNRPIEQFLELLKAHGIERVVDVRTIPKSRHNPQFSQDKLRSSLKKAGIGYEHLKELGGLRHSKKDSVNLGWRNASFRGFADYMATPEFIGGLKKLQKTAKQKKIAIMCAEAVPWRCHRSLIADALTKSSSAQGHGRTRRKWLVLHIQSRRTAKKHKLTPFLKVRKGKLMYP